MDGSPAAEVDSKQLAHPAKNSMNVSSWWSGGFSFVETMQDSAKRSIHQQKPKIYDKFVYNRSIRRIEVVYPIPIHTVLVQLAYI